MCSPLRAGTPTLNLLSFRAHATAAAPPSSAWGGTIMSRPITAPYLAAHRLAHTLFKPTPEREHQPSKRGRSGGTQKRPTTPKRAHKQARKHPKRTQPKRKHPTQPPASKHAHNKPKLPPPREHRQRPRHSAWASKMCEHGNTWQQRATGKNEAQTHDAGTQTAHTQKAQTTRFARSVRLRPQRGTAREKAAHNSPRQSAWVVVFVGVFADVCRRFWAGWFGGLGVFWGCLACFLVF